MKKVIISVFLSCVMGALEAQSVSKMDIVPSWGDQGNGTYINPVLNADYSDPDVIRVGDKFYMIASDFHFLGMQVLESDDLVNWRLISQIYHRFDFEGWDSNEHYAGGSWAPAIRFHDGKFWVYFCTPDEGLFMSTAKDPRGPWSPLVCVCNVAKWEDPCPFWDNNGQAYLGRSIHGAGPIIIHKMSDDGTRLLDNGVTVYTGPTAEGTKFYKKDGYYYLSIPEGGVSSGWQTILRSKNIYGPYEKKVVLEQGMTSVNGPHQGAMVDTPDGEWFFLHFQQYNPLGRVLHLQPMFWKDGWPVIGVDMDRNGIGEPVFVWRKPRYNQDKQICVPQTSDEFSADSLSLQWQFNHNPVNEKWSLTERKGFLMLKALKASNFIKARNTITQKTMGYLGTVTAKMDSRSMKDGQRAGLVCMGSKNMLIGVMRNDGKQVLYIELAGVVKEIAVLKNKTVYLRLVADAYRNKYQFSYSYDNDKFISVLPEFEMKTGFWKGTRVGLYNYNMIKDDGIVFFDWFRYEHDGPK